PLSRMSSIEISLARRTGFHHGATITAVPTSTPGASCPVGEVLKRIRLHGIRGAVVLGGPDGVEPERLDELAQLEGVVHVLGISPRRRAGVVLGQKALPVALVVAGHHHTAVHACPPLSLIVLPRRTLAWAIVYCLTAIPRSDTGGTTCQTGCTSAYRMTTR